ncbi:esterase-like activity of phytase family protein [Actinomycetes bacterium KLBMP 9759]
MHARARLAAAAALGLLLLTAQPAGAGEHHVTVGFLGEHRIPPGTTYNGTTVGGFSGIDRDGDTWFVVSDDRSALQPARFYTAALRFDGPGGHLSGVELTGTHPFLRPDGSTYPALSGGDGTTPDPEDIRVDPQSRDLAWSQEGERIVPTDGTPPTLIDPGVRFATRDGAFVRDLPLAPGQGASAEERGIRQNLGPEGLTFAEGGNLVVTAVEGPLLQDGPVPTRTTGALSRIVLQTRDGSVRAQYVYQQEPLFADPVPADRTASTGVTAILAIDADDPTRFLVLERSYVPGVGNEVRLYEIDTFGATDVDATGTLNGAEPVRNHLVADIGDLPVASVDNIEGMAWGPDRPDGTQTLVLVGDDNFSETQVTQFIALDVR